MTLLIQPGQADQWHAAADGRLIGTINRHGSKFYVSDIFGRYIGEFTALHTAQQRLAAHRASRDVA